MDPMNEIEQWFMDRGSEIVITQDGDIFWADLLPRDAVIVTVPRHGRGTTRALVNAGRSSPCPSR